MLILGVVIIVVTNEERDQESLETIGLRYNHSGRV
jgi:hypothetical protein